MGKHINLLDLPENKDRINQVLTDRKTQKSTLVSFRINEPEKEMIIDYFNKNFGITNFSECIRIIIHSYIKDISE